MSPAGNYEIAVQSDKLQINGRNADDNKFEPIVVFQRLAAGGNIESIQYSQPVWRRKGRNSDCQCTNLPQRSIPLAAGFCMLRTGRSSIEARMER